MPGKQTVLRILLLVVGVFSNITKILGYLNAVDGRMIRNQKSKTNRNQ